MALKGPKGAIPTTRGWVHARTGELLKSQKISESAIAEWHGVAKPAAPAPAPVVEPEPAPMQTLHEAPVVEETEVTPSQRMWYQWGNKDN